MVVKGCAQQQGEDYNQTFSPVTRMATIRSHISIADSEDKFLKKFDVSTAFLYGELEEIIYIQQPEGYDDATDRVCRLRKSLYGLKQASRCGHSRIGKFLLSLGFKQSKEDPCLDIKIMHGKRLILVLHVESMME